MNQTTTPDATENATPITAIAQVKEVAAWYLARLAEKKADENGNAGEHPSSSAISDSAGRQDQA